MSRELYFAVLKKYPDEIVAGNSNFPFVYCRLCDCHVTASHVEQHVVGRAHRLNKQYLERSYDHLPHGQALARRAVDEFPEWLELSDFNPSDVWCLVCEVTISGGNIMSHINGARHRANVENMSEESFSSSEESDGNMYAHLPRGYAIAKRVVDIYSEVYELSNRDANQVFCKICSRHIGGGDAEKHLKGKSHVLEEQKLQPIPPAQRFAREAVKRYDFMSIDSKNPTFVVCKICNRRIAGHSANHHVEGNLHFRKFQQSEKARKFNEATVAIKRVKSRHGDYFTLRNAYDAGSIFCDACSFANLSQATVDSHCESSAHKSNVNKLRTLRREQLQLACAEARSRSQRRWRVGRKIGGSGYKPDSRAIRSFTNQINTNRPLLTYFLPNDYASLITDDFPSRDVQMSARADFKLFVKYRLSTATDVFDPFEATALPNGLKRTIYDEAPQRAHVRKLLHEILFAEEAQLMMDLRSYNKKCVVLMKPQRDFFTVEMPGVSENRPSVLRGDILIIHEDADVNKPNDYSSTTFEAFIHHVNVDTIVFSMPSSFHLKPNMTYSIVFKLNRSQERKLHRAVDACPSNAFLVRETCCRTHYTPLYVIPTVTAAAKGLNPEQQRFIAHVHGSNRLSALWGPPGTGKTTTIVAAIADTVIRVVGARILVCTPSNEAADLIVERLAECESLNSRIRFEKDFLLRIPSLSRDPKTVPEKVLRFCPTVDGNSFIFPDMKEIARYSVIVTTLMTSDRLYAVGPFEKQFTHLFVDEAGHSSESLLLIALNAVGQGTKVVIAGDHKQLGPRVTVPLLFEARLHESPLLRIHNDDQLWPEVGNQLLECYRSHPAIVHLINTCYDDKLETRNKNINRFAGLWNTPLLGNCWATHCSEEELGDVPLVPPKQPILFLGHTYRESRENDSPSWMNEFEVRVAVAVVFSLFDAQLISSFEDVAIIAPYRKQVQKITESLYGRMYRSARYSRHMITQHPLTGELLARPRVPVRVATVDSFQGREAKVVIVTCVRSRTSAGLEDSKFGLGFLQQPERANVALSRAKDLLVIIGNRQVLSMDDTWRSYLDRLDAMDPGVVMNIGGPSMEETEGSAAVPLTDHSNLLEEGGGVAREE